MLKISDTKHCVRLTTADVGDFLTLANQSGLTIYDMKCLSDLEFHFLIKNKDLSVLKAIEERRGDRVEVIGHRGSWGFFSNVLTRPVFLVMVLVFFILTLFLPSRILFVIVEGNSLVSEQEIISAAADCGIRFGAVRREVRSEKCKNRLLSELPQLQWVGINTYGCVAKISVKERTKQEETYSDGSLMGLSAMVDGVIREMTVTSGNPLCAVGDAVKKGQLLVSPYIDSGMFVKGVTVQAEIYADTNRTFASVTPRNLLKRSGHSKEERKFSIRFGKKVINFFKDSGILDTSCVKMYKEHIIEFGEGFVFPISLIEFRYVYNDTLENVCISEQELSWVPSEVESMVIESMTAGGVCRSRFRSVCDDMLYYYYGEYDCYEMIAQPYDEETVKKYGEGN